MIYFKLNGINVAVEDAKFIQSESFSTQEIRIDIINSEENINALKKILMEAEQGRTSFNVRK